LGGIEPNGKATRAARDAALAIFHRTNVSLPMLEMYGEIGRDPERLITESQKALETARATQPESTVADAEYNLGAAYILADHLPEALEHSQPSVAINDKLGINHGKHAAALSQSAWILMEQGHQREAIPLARRAAAVAESIADDTELAAALTQLGAALLRV